jgi:predicted phage terminase large subunit-like protein
MLDQRLKGHPLDEDIIRRFRCWDLASTPHKGDLVPGSRTKAQDEGDPDWTIGLLVGETRKGLLVILDCKHWRDTSGEIEKGIIRTAEEDPKGTIVLLWQDPGQAGPYQIQSYVKALRGTARVEAIPARQNKQEYAQLPSRTANKGRILVQKAEWNRCFFSQLTGFPKKGLHDDCVDALSLACTWIWDNPRSGNRAPQTIGEGFAIPAHVNNDVRTTARFRSL